MNSYLIINIEHINDVDFSEVVDDSAESVTINKDKTKFVLEYAPPIPPSLSAIPNKQGPYTTGIYNILNTDEWRYEFPLDDFDGDGVSGSPPPIIK
jgi:hypothetical protein